jgi:hypothetical protein
MLYLSGVGRGDPYYRFEFFDYLRNMAASRLSSAEIATHFHMVVPPEGALMERTALTCVTAEDKLPVTLTMSLLNSSSALYWFKQVCYNKAAGSDAERDRYVYAGGKIQQLPVPSTLLEDLRVKDRASTLARRCSDLGAVVPGLHPRKLFEQPGEAYTNWYRSIAGYQQPHTDLSLDWRTPDELKAAWQSALEEMRRLRGQMVALQEEMDWLMYGAYGLLPLDYMTVNLNGPAEPVPIEQLDRPYRLVQHERPVPTDWPESQQELWRVRLEAIAEDPHIGQVEHPAYKRRWDGLFGDRDFLQAYEWWLREKAEWLLEYRHGGGPIQL